MDNLQFDDDETRRKKVNEELNDFGLIGLV